MPKQPPISEEQLRQQFEQLLALPDSDPQAVLLKDLLGSVLRLKVNRLDMLGMAQMWERTRPI